MNKIRELFLILVTIFLVIFFYVKHEIKSAKNEIIIEQKDKIIEQKNDIIETKNFQQKLIKKPTSNSSIVARDKWLQLVWKKGDKAS